MKGKRIVRSWTKEEDEYMRKNYGYILTAEIAKNLNRSTNAIKCRSSVLGIYQTEEQRKKHKGIGQFKVGKPAWNVGKKQTEYLSPEKIEKVKKSQFKKGYEPHNTLYDGVITIRKMKDRQYQFIRLSKAKWDLLHLHVWKQHHGEIKEGCLIVFKDGNFMNCNITNLEQIRYEDHMMKNTIRRLPADIQEIIQLNAKLRRKILKLEKNHGTKQN